MITASDLLEALKVAAQFMAGFEDDESQIVLPAKLAAARLAIAISNKAEVRVRCSSHTLLDWVNKTEVDSGRRAGVPSDMAEKLKILERENCKLRQANEILRKAIAYFAQAELVL